MVHHRDIYNWPLSNETADDGLQNVAPQRLDIE